MSSARTPYLGARPEARDRTKCCLRMRRRASSSTEGAMARRKGLRVRLPSFGPMRRVSRERIARLPTPMPKPRRYVRTTGVEDAANDVSTESDVADGGVELATELQADQGMIKQTRSRERLMETDVRLWDESSVWDESPKRD